MSAERRPEAIERQPLFTVCTATYDRAHTLPGVYESLVAQTVSDFEWLVVDDGSTDETGSMVAGWQKRSAFPIRYLWQEHGGKPSAVNRGVREALGRFFLILDSDDTCVPSALEELHRTWESIPVGQREAFSGVAVHCMDSAGRIFGTPLPEDLMDAHPYQMAARHRARDEKWGFHRTEVLRRYPYPIFEHETWMPESLVWNRVGRRYKLRYSNIALRVYSPNPSGITAKVRRLMLENPNGTALYFVELASLDIPLARRMVGAVRYVRHALHAEWSVRHIVRSPANSLLVALMFPLGWVVWLRDRLRHGSMKKPNGRKAKSATS